MSRPHIERMWQTWGHVTKDSNHLAAKDARALLDYVAELEAQVKGRDMYIETLRGLHAGELASREQRIREVVEILND